MKIFTISMCAVVPKQHLRVVKKQMLKPQKRVCLSLSGATFPVKRNGTPYIWMLLLLLGVLYRLPAKAQLQKLESNRVANVSLLTASPSAAAFKVFTDTPVSQFTGTPNITVPLHGVSYKELSVDLTLQYHQAIGSKPDAFPGSVGNGWMMNTGVITRISRGVSPANYPPGTILPLNPNPTSDPTWSSTAKLQNYIQTQTVFYNDNGRYDEYAYSFAGSSGKFYIDHTDAFHIKTAQGEDILVQKDAAIDKNFTMPTETQVATSCTTTPYTNIINQKNITYRFILTDSRGVKYTFGGKDESIEFTRPGMGYGVFDVNNENTIPTSWYLTSIESPNGYKIDLNYKRDKFYITNEIGVSDRIISPSTWGDNSNAPLGKVIKSTLYHPSYLDEIVTPIEKVKFNWSIASGQLGYNFTVNCMTPTDLNSQIYFYAYPEIKDAPLSGRFPNKLDNFVVSTSAGARKKKVELSYTNSTTDRLKLLSVKLRGDSDTPSNFPVYTFDYNTVVPLPAYLSFKTDDWGFYNNKGDQYITSAVPVYYYNLFTNATTRQAYLDSRKPDIAYTQAEILNKVTYPTGGYTMYEYENNEYGRVAKFWPATILENSGGTAQYTGGLRIKRITNYDYTNHVATEKKYFYKKDYATSGNGSSGVLSFEPRHYSFFTGAVTSPARYVGTSDQARYTGTMTYTQYNTDPLNASSYKGNHISYSEVAEVDLDGSYMVYKFKNYDNGYHDKNAENFIADNTNVGEFWKDDEMNSLEIERSQLLSQFAYNSSNTLKQSSTYTYNTNAARFDNNVRRVKFIPNPIFNANYPSLRYTANLVYTYFPYLESKTVTNFEIGGNIADAKTYTYNEQYRTVTTQSSVNSKGQTVLVTNTYPHDYPADAVSLAMKNKHIIAPLIETKTSVAGTQVSLLHTTYYAPYTGVYVPQDVKIQNGANPIEVRQKFTQYDAKGNVQELQKPNGAKEVYLWGYKGQYLMAKILGSDYATAGPLFDQAFLDVADTNPGDAVTVLNNGRNSLSSTNAYSQITTYLYNPLVGISSITDPNKKTIAYQYDPLGRLKTVNNSSGTNFGSVRASYCYNYAGQPMDCSTMAPTGSIAAATLNLIAEKSPLPVTLLEFDAVRVEYSSALSWSTTSETNSDRFEVQRSKEGKEWVKLGDIIASGESSNQQKYSFTDKTPLKGENLYRLKMLDKDGTFAYSRIRSLTFDSNETIFYPNPITVGEKLNLVTNDLSKISGIKIFDSAGKVVLRSGASNQIDTHNLASGLYIVQVTYIDGSLTTHRIAKQ